MLLEQKHTKQTNTKTKRYNFYMSSLSPLLWSPPGVLNAMVRLKRSAGTHFLRFHLAQCQCHNTCSESQLHNCTSVDIAIFLHPPLRKTVGVRRVLVGRGRRRERWVQWLQNHPLLPDRWPPTDGGESKNKDKMKFDGSHFSQSKTDGALTTGRHGMYL